MPTAWFNVVPHMDAPPEPPLHPATRQPVGPDDLVPLFPMALIGQEVTTEPYVDIPGEVLDVLGLWRPTPLVRAERLEKALGTPARIYYKDESVSPAGSHKPNTAVPQAFYNKAEGTARLATETGAGQWGSALCFASALFGLECKVYMVRASYEQKPYRRVLMETWGGNVVPSPVDDPEHPGSLGTAISDAVRDAGSRADTHYSLGSVLNHVLLHQTVIGQEAKVQLALAGEERPDVVIGCCGGGSNLGGISLPFVPDRDVRLVAVEPTSCPTLTAGRFEYDFGDDWEHDITVEDVLPAEPGVAYPRCTAGRRACPPEDCGGIWGYQDLLEILADPRHAGHAALLEWLGLGAAAELDPAHFDPGEVNESLSGLSRLLRKR